MRMMIIRRTMLSYFHSTHEPRRFELGDPLRGVTLFALLFLEVLAVRLWTLPQGLDFNSWAFWDPGANLTVQYLIHEGYRPSVDFPYHYGLLPLLLGSAWSTLFGLTPASYLALMTGGNLFIAWGFFRYARALKLDILGLTLFAVGIPFAIRGDYPNLAHACEAALLANGIAEQTAGRRRSALALSSLAAFAKPSMGFLYGLLLIILELNERRKLPPKNPLWTFFSPSVAVAGVFVGVAAAFYGARIVFLTLSPVTGAEAYRASHYGLLNGGLGLFYFPGVHVGYYLGSPVAFWVLGTSWLIAYCVGYIAYYVHHPEEGLYTNAGEALLTCTILHVLFISTFFGSPASWTYYSYILLMGLAATATLEVFSRSALWALVVIGVLANKGMISSNYTEWRTWKHDPSSAGLWLIPEEQSEWIFVQALIGDRSAAILDVTGAAEVLFSKFQKPVSLYFTPGLFTSADIGRKIAQLSNVSTVVVPSMTPLYQNYRPPDAILVVMKQFRELWKGRFFTVYCRKADVDPGPSPIAHPSRK